VAENSSFRGFVTPGTGIPFTLDDSALGFDLGAFLSDPQAGQSLDDFMQQVVAGITGLPLDLVRPRWQPQPPNAPPITYSPTAGPAVPCWAAVGVTRSTPLGFPAVASVALGAAAATGYLRLSDQEEFDVLCSFYGERADDYAVALRLGLMVAQNRECLQLNNVGLINVSGRTRVPTLTQEQWWMRVDITATFRREVRQFYPILYYLSARVDITTDTGVSDTANANP
jgi:hypothetical protein